MTRLAEIEAREQAATKGLWEFSTSNFKRPADKDFVEHARQDIPYLLAQLREAEEEYARLTVGFEQLRQSLTVMQPEYEALKEKLGAVEKWRRGSGGWLEIDRILKGGE